MGRGSRLREARVPTQPMKQPPGRPSARTAKHVSAHLRRWAWGPGCGAPAAHAPHPLAWGPGCGAPPHPWVPGPAFWLPPGHLPRTHCTGARAWPLPGSWSLMSCSHTLWSPPLDPVGPCTATSHSVTVAQGVGMPGFRWPLSPEEHTGPGANRSTDSTVRVAPSQLHPDALWAHDTSVLCHRNRPSGSHRRCLCAEQRGA